jgi:hypothetical protein
LKPADGKGKLTYHDGSVFEGEFHNGKPVLKEEPEKKEEPVSSSPKSNLMRNFAISAAGLGVAGVAYYMSKQKTKKSQSSSSSSSSAKKSNRLRRRRTPSKRVRPQGK